MLGLRVVRSLFMEKGLKRNDERKKTHEKKRRKRKDRRDSSVSSTSTVTELFNLSE